MRITADFLKELDAVIEWPGDPLLPEWNALLPQVVNAVLNPIFKGGLFCIDFSDRVCILSGNPQRIVVASVSASLEQYPAARKDRQTHQQED